jgi:hypothetical protein
MQIFLKFTLILKVFPDGHYDLLQSASGVICDKNLL